MLWLGEGRGPQPDLWTQLPLGSGPCILVAAWQTEENKTFLGGLGQGRQLRKSLVSLGPPEQKW